VSTVLIPEDNRKDLRDIPEGVLAEVSILPVKHMDEVLRLALAVVNPEEFLVEPTHVVDWRTTVAEAPSGDPH
jgi:ATP-dependent Lon protease